MASGHTHNRPTHLGYVVPAGDSLIWPAPGICSNLPHGHGLAAELAFLVLAVKKFGQDIDFLGAGWEERFDCPHPQAIVSYPRRSPRHNAHAVDFLTRMICWTDVQ